MYEHSFIIDVVLQHLFSTSCGGRARGRSASSSLTCPSSSSSSSAAAAASSLLPDLMLSDADFGLRLRPPLAPLHLHDLLNSLGQFLNRDGVVPLQIRAHSLIRKALLANDIASPKDTRRHVTHPVAAALGTIREGPYTGDVSVVTWNTQALFAANLSRHEAKYAYVKRLMKKSDVGIWTETHGTVGGNCTWREPEGCVSWWAPWATTACAGVGITVKKTFLENFHAPSARWDVIVPGRAAILRLQGPKGSLHIMAFYFPTGTEIQEDDRRELTPNLLDPSFKALRAAMRRKVANALAPSSLALSIPAGDFNYVAENEDRISLASGQASGGRDSSEENHWKSLTRPRGLMEMYQGCFTHASAAARSRLDRFYSNVHTSEALNKQFATTVLEWVRISQRTARCTFANGVPRGARRTRSSLRRISDILTSPEGLS